MKQAQRQEWSLGTASWNENLGLRRALSARSLPGRAARLCLLLALARLDEPPFRPLQPDGREDPVPVGAGIDRNPVRMRFGLVDDGVAVDDDEAVIGAALEESVANPAEVLGALLGDRHARADAGMDEQIVAEAEAVGHAFEEGPVLLGHVFLKAAHDLARRRVEGPALGDAVALGAFVAAVGQPVGDDILLAAQARSEIHVIAWEDRLGEVGL